eukprot:scaffold396_cov352-Pavlova_lutheri.AAC.4
MILLTTASKALGKRNTIPLLHNNGLVWPRYDTDLVWQMDAIGGNDAQPHLFAVNASTGAKVGNNAGQQHKLRNCEYLKGWRGNARVVEFPGHVWNTTVHKYMSGQKSKVNQSEHTHLNREAFFLLDICSLLSRQWLQCGPEPAP